MGWGNLCGIYGAQLAVAGCGGLDSAIEGDFGFCKTVSAHYDMDRFFNRLACKFSAILHKIAAEHNINPNMLRSWKKVSLANAFDESRQAKETRRKETALKKENERMLRTIGQLTLERAFLQGCFRITETPLPKLTAIIDWYSRMVVCWNLSDTLDTACVLQAVADAVAAHGCPAILNSDQGCQFTSVEYKALLKRLHIAQSMDGKSRWADNMIERWLRSLKTEEIYLNEYETPRALRQAIRAHVQQYNATCSLLCPNPR